MSKMKSYISDIKCLQNLTVQDIITLSSKYLLPQFKSCPWNFSDSEGRTLEHGTAVLETEDQCNAYMAAYGPMHYHKLLYAFNETEFPFSELKKGFEIYDWGCGQGIGTIALIEILRKKELLRYLKKVTLEEPSYIARERALLHVNQAIGNYEVEIFAKKKYLPSYIDNSNSIESIGVNELCAIHIFSNILDIESINLKGVSTMITSSGNKHIVLCIGPANLNENRINTFINYFKKDGIRRLTDYREPMFGKHPNGKAYGCLIKSFTYLLSGAESVLNEYSYFAPIQLYAAYTDEISKSSNIDSAFEVLAPFDMTAHREITPINALISNLISRGCPTLASKKVIDALSSHGVKTKEREYITIARIQKTLIEAMISGRLSYLKNEWKILVLEDNTDVADIAIKDFCEMYTHLIEMTEIYGSITLPKIIVFNKFNADVNTKYDIVIDISIDKYSEPKKVTFLKYRADNDCYFVVRSSKEIFSNRCLYTTERIKYKPFS
jgi:hypothetical protein